MNDHLPSYLLLAVLAGAYVGLGVILALSVGAPLASASLPVVSLVMGLSFAVALLLVVFAGAELFTGNHMVYTVSTLSGVTTWKDTFKVDVVFYRKCDRSVWALFVNCGNRFV